MLMNKYVSLTLTSLSLLFSAAVFAQTPDFDPEKGYPLDKEYYDSLTLDPDTNIDNQTRSFSEKFPDDFTFSVYSTGAYTYFVGVYWTDPQGVKQKVTRNHFSAGRVVRYTIPKGSSNASLEAFTLDGFFGTPIVGLPITPELVASHNNFLDFRFWGSTLFPRWALKD